MSEYDFSRKESKPRKLRDELIGEDKDSYDIDTRPLEKRIADGDLFSEEGILGWLGGLLNTALTWGAKVVDLVGQGVNWLFSLPGSLGGWWGALSQATVQLFFFDWNQTDKQIDTQIKNLANQTAEQFGEFVGFTVCGAANIGASALIPKVGPMIAKLATVEFLPEAWGELKAALRVAARSLTQSGALFLYKNVRGWLKSLSPLLDGGLKSFLDSWGDGKKPWTIYGGLTKAAEKIPNDTLKNLATGALEGCIEGWLEAGFITGSAIDTTIENMLKVRQVSGEGLVTVEVEIGEAEGTAGAVEKENTLAIVARPEDLEQQISEAMATKQLLGLNNVGKIVGLPAEEYVISRLLRRSLTILCHRGKDRPPWRIGGRAAPQTTISIPNPKLGLRWFEIKKAVRQWQWGRFKAEMLLESGRKIIIHGASAAIATKKAKDLQTLCQDNYYAINVV